MEASKVTISPTTVEWNRLGKKKKTNLRRKLIIEYIQSKPAGTLIKMGEFREVCHFTTDPNTNAFVQRMLRDGVISQYAGEKPRTHYYAVTGAVRLVKPKATPPPPEDEPTTEEPVRSNHNLTEYAKQFAWERNSDSLREFVAYMDGKELELRRQADVE